MFALHVTDCTAMCSYRVVTFCMQVVKYICRYFSLPELMAEFFSAHNS